MKRQARRPRHPFAGKLTLDDAVRIRARYDAGESARKLAAEFGVAPASVHAILRGEAHASTLRVSVADATYAELAATAATTGSSPEEVASQLIEQGLSSSEGNTTTERTCAHELKSKQSG